MNETSENLKSTLLKVVYAGRRKSDGKRPCPNPSLCEEVHDDEGEHPGCFAQNSDPPITGRHGPGNEGSDQGNVEYE